MPFQVPTAIKQSHNYIQDVYEPCVYLLLKCRREYSSDPSCLYRFSSVDHTAILVKAYEDLLKMREVLLGRHVTIESAHQEWLESSREFLFQNLWNEQYQTFLPRQLHTSPNSTKKWIVEPDASIFVGLWTEIKNESRVNNMASKLMERDGYNSFFFNCGIYGIWSLGGCVPNSSISPFLNYLISTGLYRNDVHGMAWYISNLTTNRLFLEGSNESVVVDFAEELDTASGKPFPYMDSCALTSTTTAAIVYDLSTGFTPFPTFLTDPPIKNSGVIALVVFELVIAFSIGASCLLLSLRLLRQEFQQSEEARQSFVLEDGYFSVNSMDGNSNINDANSSIQTE